MTSPQPAVQVGSRWHKRRLSWAAAQSQLRGPRWRLAACLCPATHACRPAAASLDQLFHRLADTNMVPEILQPLLNLPPVTAWTLA